MICEIALFAAAGASPCLAAVPLSEPLESVSPQPSPQRSPQPSPLPIAPLEVPQPQPSGSPVPSPSPSTSPSLSMEKGPLWSLDEVKQMARENNPDLGAARAAYSATSKTVWQAIAGYLPHAEAEGRLDYSTLPSPSAGSTAQLGIPLAYPGVTASVNDTVFDFGRNLERIAAARSDTRASESELAAVRNAVDLEVERAFYDSLAAEQLLAVSQEGVKQFAETLRRTRVLVETGTRPSYDLSQAQVEMSKAQLKLIEAESARDIARITLLNIVGRPGIRDFRLAAPGEAKLAPAASFKLDQLVDTALDGRPELAASLARASGARERRSAELLGMLPSIGAYAWYGYYLPNYPAAIGNAWGVGAAVQWHVFDSFQSFARAGELGARAEQLDALNEKTRDAVLSEVEQRLLEYRQAEAGVTIGAEQLEAARESFNLAQKRYEASVGTILELLIAETGLLNSEAQDVQARFQQQEALAALRIAVGGRLPESRVMNKGQ